MTTKRISITAALTAVTAALALSATSIAATSGAAVAGAVKCNSSFTATIRQGPDKGWAVHGTMSVNASPSGVLSGTITPATGKASSFVGQLTGPAISIEIYIGSKNGMIFGNGSLLMPVSAKSCAIGGGTFAGVRGGDIGDWEVATTSPGCLPGAVKDREGLCIPAYIRYSGGGVAPQGPFTAS